MSVSQNFPNILPSLNLNFAQVKQLDPRISYSRASTGTFYDGKTTAKAEENLVLYSQELNNAVWVVEDVSITANTTAAPDGTTTADTITENTANADHRVKSPAIPWVSGLPYVISFFVKNGDADYIQFSGGASLGANIFANFDIATGVTGSSNGVTPSIVAVGGGWYRCIIVGTGASTTSQDFSTGQASHPIRPLSCLQSAVFLLNSRSHHFTATPSSFDHEDLHPTGAHLLPKLRC